MLISMSTVLLGTSHPRATPAAAAARTTIPEKHFMVVVWLRCCVRENGDWEGRQRKRVQRLNTINGTGRRLRGLGI